jgi:hypothetical protein
MIPQRPGQIIYAELDDLKSWEEVPSVILPPTPYTNTEYAEINVFQNQSNPEPIYQTFQDLA